MSCKSYINDSAGGPNFKEPHFDGSEHKARLPQDDLHFPALQLRQPRSQLMQLKTPLV